MKKISLIMLLSISFITSDIITTLNIETNTNIRFNSINGEEDHTFYLTQDNSNDANLHKVTLYLNTNEEKLGEFKLKFNGENFLINKNGNKIEMEYSFDKIGTSKKKKIVLAENIIIGDALADNNDHAINTPTTNNTFEKIDREIGEFSLRTKEDLTQRNYKAGTYRGVLTITYSSS